MPGPGRSIYAEQHLSHLHSVQLLSALLGVDGPLTTETVGEYLARWLEIQRGRLQESSCYNYDNVINGQILPDLADVPMIEVTTRMLNTVWRKLINEGGHRGVPLAARTVHMARGILHKAFEDAVLEGDVLVNPVTRSRAPFRDCDGLTERRPAGYWTQDQLNLFLELIAGHRFRNLYTVLATTGMRRGEVVGLDRTEVDAARGLIHLRHSLHQRRRDPASRGQLKTGTPRDIAVGPTCLAAIADEMAKPRGTSGPESWTPLFARPSGEQIEPEWVTDDFRAFIAKHPELPKVRLHDLRHTHAALLMERGVPLIAVSQRLGHRSPWTTEAVYGHVTPRLGRDAADEFEALVSLESRRLAREA